MANITLLPSAKVPLVYEGENTMTTEWYRFFWNIYGFTGTGVVPVNKGGTGLDTIGNHQLIIGNANNVFEPASLSSASINISYPVGFINLELGTSGVVPGTYGSASSVGIFTVNAYGVLTNAANTLIGIDASQIISGTLPVIRGGTGQSSYVDGELLIGNSAGNTLTKNTLSAGTGISITNGAGTILIANTGVLSVGGTAPVVSSGGANPVISMAAANTTTNGYLTSTDWNTFNNKAPATSGTSILYGNGSGGFSNVTIGSGISFAGGTLSATGSGGTVTAVTGVAPIASSGGTTPAISISQATTTTDGYLSSTDWNTFNNKQPAGTYVTSISIASSNGFTGTSSGGATPSLTLATSVTGILKGNGTAISAATSGTDYAPATSGSSILYGNGAGGFSNVTIGTGVSFAGGTLSATGSGGTVTSVSGTGTVNGITLTGTVTSSGSLTLGGTLGSIANSQLTNSTISGVALGGNLFSLTAGTGVSFSAGTTYNGSTAITINATGTGGTVTSVAALTLGTTGTDLSSTVANSTTTPVITLNVPTASAANRGALSSTDWSTFNSKQAALVSGTNIKTVGGVSLLGSGDVGTIGVTYGGTGTSTAFTAGSVVFAGASGVYSQNNANFFWDNSNVRLGIGTNSPDVRLRLTGANVAFKGQLVIDSTDYAQITAYNGATQYGNILWGTTAGGAAVIGMTLGTTLAYPTIFNTNNTERMRINAGAPILCLAGGSTTATGTGIAFPATQSASSDANTLDDYEEGDFSPTVVGSTSAGTGTYTVSIGKYTKVGGVVHIQAFIQWVAHTGTGNLKLGNLPFTTLNSTLAYSAIAIGYIQNIALTAGNIATGFSDVNATTISMYQTPTGGGATTAVPMDTFGEIIYAITYRAS